MLEVLGFHHVLGFFPYFMLGAAFKRNGWGVTWLSRPLPRWRPGSCAVTRRGCECRADRGPTGGCHATY